MEIGLQTNREQKLLNVRCKNISRFLIFLFGRKKFFFQKKPNKKIIIQNKTNKTKKLTVKNQCPDNYYVDD